MRVLICGSRTWCDSAAIEVEVLALREQWGGDLTIVHGAAKGADRIADTLARHHGVKVEPHPADWNRYGPGAGPIRNKQMLKTGIDLVVAFRSVGASKGTDDMTRIARRAGVTVIVHHE